mmetsp:Transcript_8050/g.22232  ORF Transcript_8050/g.22232 Transcript_8050/m.22232 type:complete len:175 (-) Transcript_8050:259-783(-)
MAACRCCSENVFGWLMPERQVAARPPRVATTPLCVRDVAAFEARQEDEIENLIKEWEQYAHPRAAEFFAPPSHLKEVLRHLARGVHRTDDPILGSGDKCVFWYGQLDGDGVQAHLRMTRPGEPTESGFCVNRVLAFIFATDESFEVLMRLPKDPFKMCCGNQLCVHLSHISNDE